MLLGASLVPWYFESRVNLFVALAPVASLHHVEVPIFKKIAKYWRVVQFVARKFGIFDMLNTNWWEEEASLLFCDELFGICDELLAYFADSDPEVDNLDRFNVFLANFPAGTGYENLIYYAQDIDHNEWRLFNYGELDNMNIYGTIEPPKVPIQNLNIPVAVFSGTYDTLADPLDVANLV